MRKDLLDTVLLCYTLEAIRLGNRGLFLAKLSIWYTGMVRVVNQSRQINGETGERVGTNAIRMIMENGLWVGFLIWCDVRSNDTTKQFVNRKSHML